MKKIFIILLSIILIFSAAYCEQAATPTDLVEVPEKININELYPNRHVQLRIIQEAYYLGDEVILGFELIDFPPVEIIYIEWQYSKDEIEWFPVENEHGETFSFIVDETNSKFWYRVMVNLNYLLFD